MARGFVWHTHVERLASLTSRLLSSGKLPVAVDLPWSGGSRVNGGYPEECPYSSLDTLDCEQSGFEQVRTAAVRAQ